MKWQRLTGTKKRTVRRCSEEHLPNATEKLANFKAEKITLSQLLDLLHQVKELAENEKTRLIALRSKLVRHG